jgi:TonB family protein
MIKKSLLFLAFISMSVAAMAQADTSIFPLPKDLPKYPDGRIALEEFIQQNIVYPEYEKSMGIEGTVVVGCDVELDGTLSNFRIESTVEGSVGFDAEAIRVCQKIGKFTPCLRNGKPLAFDTDIYVKFDLNNGDEMEMAIAKLSKKELKEIEKDAKLFCEFIVKTTDAQVAGDEEKYEKLTSKYQKELDALDAKYTLGTTKNAQYKKLTKPCMDDMFKSMGIVDVDGDGLFTQEEAELTAKELKQIEKDAKVFCKLMNEMVTDMLKAQKDGDMERKAAIVKEYDPKLYKIYKTYREGSKAQQRLAEVIKPCLEDAMNRLEIAIKK